MKNLAAMTFSVLRDMFFDEHGNPVKFGLREKRNTQDDPFDEYISAADKDDSFIGRYIKGSLAQKSMVTNRIYRSGNLLAGYSVEYKQMGLKGIKDYWSLIIGRKVGGGR